MNDLIYLESLPTSIRDAFSKKVMRIAAHLGIDPNWLMQVMWAESKIKPDAKNIQEGRLIAVGLIQFTNAAGIRNWGESLERILAKGHLEQLDLVQRYFEGYSGKMHSYFDVYAVTFFPAMIGCADSWIFQTSKLPASLIARQNSAVNINKDGYITVTEFKEYLRRSVAAKFREKVFGPVVK
jgi:hypothetical protein